MGRNEELAGICQEVGVALGGFPKIADPFRGSLRLSEPDVPFLGANRALHDGHLMEEDGAVDLFLRSKRGLF